MQSFRKINTFFLFIVLFFTSIETQAVAQDIRALSQSYLAGEIQLKDLIDTIFIQVENGSLTSLDTDIKSKVYDVLVVQGISRARGNIENGDEVSSELLLNFLSKLISPGSEEERSLKQMQEMVLSLKIFNEIISSQNSKSLEEASNKAQKVLDKTIFILKLKDYLRRDAGKSLITGSPFFALEKISYLNYITGGEKTLLLLSKQVLERLSSQVMEKVISFQDWTLNKQVVKEYLQQALMAEPSIKNLLININASYAIYCIKRSMLDGVKSSYDVVLQLRPDPNQENQEFRKVLVLESGRGETREFAKARLSELAESDLISVSDKLFLAMKGLYGLFFQIISLLFGFFVSAGAVFLVVRIFRAVSGVGKKIEDVTGKMHEKSQLKRGVRYSIPVSGDDEYTQLLREFGLDDTASEADIKRAYREAMKKFHPDTASAQGITEEQRDAEFRKLKRKHDRIMQIRGGWFGGRR